MRHAKHLFAAAALTCGLGLGAAAFADDGDDGETRERQPAPEAEAAPEGERTATVTRDDGTTVTIRVREEEGERQTLTIETAGPGSRSSVSIGLQGDGRIALEAIERLLEDPPEDLGAWLSEVTGGRLRIGLGGGGGRLELGPGGALGGEDLRDRAEAFRRRAEARRREFERRFERRLEELLERPDLPPEVAERLREQLERGFGGGRRAPRAGADRGAEGTTPRAPARRERDREPGFLGVYGVEADDRAGVAVSEVYAGGPAAAAGLRVGDVITAVDGAPTPTMDALGERLGACAAGDAITLTVVREGGEALELEVTLGRHRLR